MFPHNNHNQFMPQAPPPPHFPTSALADVGPNGRSGGVGNALAMGIGNIAPVSGMGQIDWAQLAQQWIHMRDQTVSTASTTPGPPAPPNFGIIPLAPPPPIISNAPEYQRQQLSNLHYEEHGEADMDMDDDTERGHGVDMQISTPPPPMPPAMSNQISQSDSNAAASGRGKQQQEQQWTNWPGQSNKQAINNPTAHIPSLLKLNVSNPNEPHGLGHHQQQQQQQQLEVSNMGGSASEIDTNKRKMLPAWIREGLEKMEREKQRQMEREQPITTTNLDLDLLGSSTDTENHHHNHKQQQQQGQNVKQVSSKTLTTPVNLMNLTNVVSNKQRPKYCKQNIQASDSEDSHEELSGNAPASAQLNKGKDMLIRRTTRRRSDSQTTEHTQDIDEQEEQEEELPPRSEIRNDAIATRHSRQVHDNGKNYEERLADLMMVVRRTLTEILLETTNEEIAIIASETMKAHRAKASSAQVIRKSALSSITGNLGLAAYGDSSTESEGDDDDDDDGHKDGDDDDRTWNTTTTTDSGKLSAEELKARIRRSKRSFEKVIVDIEQRVAQQEQRDGLVLEKQRKLEMERMAERRKGSGSQREPICESLLLGSSNDKIKQFNGKRPSRKERTTRFSDNKDVKQSNQSFIQHVVVAAVSAPVSMPATTSSSSTAVPSKIKPIPNVATNLLQMPESVATMLSAADKALQKVNKASDRKPKPRRRSSTTSTSSSSSGSGSGSSTSSSSTSSSSDSSTSATTKSSSSRSVNSKKKNTSSSSKSRRTAASSSNSRRHHHHHHHQRDQDGGSSSRSRSRNKYDRRENDREREHRHHYGGSSSSNMHRRRPNKRDSSHSGDEHRDNRHRSSRHGDYAKAKRHHTRSRSRSRSRNSQHYHQNHSTISHLSSSSASHHRKRV
ncbi:uncharacterized protein Dwil_GK13768 [Drosophila willistoni]|uniref:Arginine/serine-rich protein PNISR n=1 Tax=Drosophila willistoni TaxID=7260 RepID=B4NIM5_DROWI|nr:uncharacterized protein Dwil_GK13768 [Drosophila willistoni]